MAHASGTPTRLVQLLSLKINFRYAANLLVGSYVRLT